MSQTRDKLPLSIAYPLADAIAKRLEDVCERIMVVGSVRRERYEVGDIEILTIPQFDTDLYGQPKTDILESRLHELIDEGKLTKGPRWGPKAKAAGIVRWPGIMLEIYTATEASWPVQAVIRTGPADFSQAAVTPRARGGLLPDGLVIANGGRLWRADDCRFAHDGTLIGVHANADPIQTTEDDLIRSLLGRYVAPSERNDWRRLVKS